MTGMPGNPPRPMNASSIASRDRQRERRAHRRSQRRWVPRIDRIADQHDTACPSRVAGAQDGAEVAGVLRLVERDDRSGVWSQVLQARPRLPARHRRCRAGCHGSRSTRTVAVSAAGRESGAPWRGRRFPRRAHRAGRPGRTARPRSGRLRRGQHEPAGCPQR